MCVCVYYTDNSLRMAGVLLKERCVHSPSQVDSCSKYTYCLDDGLLNYFPGSRKKISEKWPTQGRNTQAEHRHFVIPKWKKMLSTNITLCQSKSRGGV